MGATELDLYASMDGTVCYYRRFFWHSILQSIHQADSVDSGTAVCAQLTFQLRFPANTIPLGK